MKHSDSDVRAASVLSIGHLARIHQYLPNAIIPVILEILNNQENIIKRRAHSMKEDLQQYTPKFWKQILDAKNCN